LGAWTGLRAERLDLVVREPDRVDQLVRGAFPQPHATRLQPESGQRLDQRNLSALDEVQRANHRGHDGGEPVELAFPGAMLGVQVVEVTLRDAGGEAVHDVLEPSLREGDDLIAAPAYLQRSRDELERCAPVD